MSDYILLVEDNPRDVEITLDLLKEAGNRSEIIVLNDGESAMAFLERRGEFISRREGFPRVILLDIKMPRVSGLEVLRAIKGNPALRAIPVVLLTSSRQEQDMLAAYDLKADGYAIKPPKPAQLASTIESAIRAAASRRD